MNRNMWLAERRKHLTASEVAQALGVSPYGSPVALWASKHGCDTPPVDPAKQTAMSEGLAVEPIIKAEYEYVTGNALVGLGQYDLVTCEEYPWLAGTPDDLVATAPGVMEAKLVDSLDASGYGDPSRGHVPAHVRIQALMYMFLTERDWCDVEVCVAPRRHFSPLVLIHLPRDQRQHLVGLDWATYRVPRNDRLISTLVARGQEWYERHVIAGEPPEPTRIGDAAMLYPEPSNLIVVAETEQQRAALQRYAHAKRVAKELEGADEALKLAIGEAGGMRGAEGKASWYAVAGRERTDWKAIAHALRGEVPDTDWDAIISEHTRRGNGYRAIRFTPRKNRRSKP